MRTEMYQLHGETKLEFEERMRKLRRRRAEETSSNRMSGLGVADDPAPIGSSFSIPDFGSLNDSSSSSDSFSGGGGEFGGGGSSSDW